MKMVGSRASLTDVRDYSQAIMSRRSRSNLPSTGLTSTSLLAVLFAFAFHSTGSNSIQISLRFKVANDGDVVMGVAHVAS